MGKNEKIALGVGLTALLAATGLGAAGIGPMAGLLGTTATPTGAGVVGAEALGTGAGTAATGTGVGAGTATSLGAANTATMTGGAIGETAGTTVAPVGKSLASLMGTGADKAAMGAAGAGGATLLAQQMQPTVTTPMGLQPMQRKDPMALFQMMQNRRMS